MRSAVSCPAEHPGFAQPGPRRRHAGTYGSGGGPGWGTRSAFPAPGWLRKPPALESPRGAGGRPRPRVSGLPAPHTLQVPAEPTAALGRGAEEGRCGEPGHGFSCVRPQGTRTTKSVSPPAEGSAVGREREPDLDAEQPRVRREGMGRALRAGGRSHTPDAECAPGRAPLFYPVLGRSQPWTFSLARYACFLVLKVAG
ncbi:uncharacterized protein LOC144576702 [Callithrix jacchus]